MYLIREVMHCKPGKVKDMVTRFKGLSKLVQQLGYKPFRVYTDVSGEPYWTVVAVTEVDNLDAFREMEAKTMALDEARKLMAGYHDLVQQGRREIYKVE